MFCEETEKMDTNQNERIYTIDALRIIVAFFVVVIHFPFPGTVGKYLWINAYFAVPFFYLVAGYFLGTEDKEELERKIKKRAKHIFKLFVYTAIVYVSINLLYYVIYKGTDISTYVSSIFTTKSVMKFVLLNVWPFFIGGAIWFLQAMVYSYIIILGLVKTKLIRYDLYIAILLLILNSLLGEFSTWLSLPLVMASTFTRALPYMLLGRVIRNNINKIRKVKTIELSILVLLSIILCLAEYYILNANGILGYTGHYQGNTILAVLLMIFAIQNKNCMKNTVLYNWGKKYSLAIYLIHQPLGLMLEPHLGKLKLISPIIIFALSFLIAYIYYTIKKIILKNIKR